MDLIDGTFVIIMADDDEDERVLIQEAFEELGFPRSLRYAQDGEELLSYLNRCVACCDHYYFLLPAFILLDLNMPVRNGWESLRELKKCAGLGNIPVIIWTSSDDETDRSRSIEMGADAFLTKSESYGDLLSSVRNLMDIYCGSHTKNEIEIPVTVNRKF